MQLPSGIPKPLKTPPYFNEPFYVGFNIAGYELGLMPDESTVGNNTVTYWGVDDVNSTFERFLALGAKVDEAPQDVGSNIVTASVKDPWGNIIGLIYNPHFTL